MTDSQEPNPHQTGMQEAQINRALGVFMLFFAYKVTDREGEE